MNRRILLSNKDLEITLLRLCHQLVENHEDFDNTVLIGMQPRGSYLAKRIHALLGNILGKDIPLGLLDSTFHRDDFRRRNMPLQANATQVPFLIENKKVVLVDDVLYTGRSVRAALDAMTAFGRPQSVELLVLIDRKYTRELPIAARYVGKSIDSVQSQRVKVEWTNEADNISEDAVWLISDQA